MLKTLVTFALVVAAFAVEPSGLTKWRACTRQAKQLCAKPQLCADGKEPELGEEDCCFSCKPAKPICAKTACKAAKETFPVCEKGSEKFYKFTNKPTCCPTCKREPTCKPTCDKGKVCVRSRKTDAKGKCRPKKKRRFKLRAQKAVDKAFLKNATAAEVEELFAEFVQRFCDKPKNVEICKRKTELLDGLKVKIMKNINDESAKVDDVEVVVEVEVAEGPTVASNEVEGEVRRMLLSADDTTNLLNDALADVDATEGFNATVADSDASSAQPVVASAALVSALAVLIL